MDELQIRGLALMFAIAVLFLLIVLRKQPRAIWLFAMALVIVGLGYLATTPAPAEFAGMLFGSPAPEPATAN